MAWQVGLSLNLEEAQVAIIGLGYVGLPLAIEMGKKYPTVGYDTDPHRIAELAAGVDSTRETDATALKKAKHLSFSSETEALTACNVYIVTVPTPIDEHKKPNCNSLIQASETIGRVIAPGDVVVYESTVYPGATEEVCIPVLESVSGLTYNQDFFAGYSPERINPGDKHHKLADIVKVTSGSTPEAAEFVDALYRSIVAAGTHRTSSIQVAEAAKVIENTQRDLNIALVNELALIFNRMDIDTEEVLAAAGTKWNFLPFQPGLVGGHCIGVDPYYLTHKAQAVGYHPEVILAGRRINDRMGEHIADEILKLMTRRGINPVGARVLVLGLAFKENCPDVRNTKVVDLVNGLQEYRIDVDVYDPWVDVTQARAQYGLELVENPESHVYDGAVLAVAHDEFRANGALYIDKFCKEERIVYDVKHVLPTNFVDGRL